MRDDDGGLIAPASFLPTAERFGLINAIDRWVTQAAVAVAAGGRRVAVNLSANSIGDIEIVRTARTALERGIDPAMLIFEITETAAIANLAEARDFAGELTGIGCELAIDDFGTGFGSLTYLKHIPSRYVKIDREFIKDLTSSSTDQQVVGAVVGIARSLGKRTIAEGVEDAETLSLIRELGVDYVQGFFTGRPAQIWPAPVTEISSARAAA
jgi:EAL domain-containing protein (putative c-di-GMP-specific phosphodiesterase class I)